MTKIYMYAEYSSGEPHVRISKKGVRPTEEALNEVRNRIRDVYDPEKAKEAAEEKKERLSLSGSLEGQYVHIGMAEFDKNAGTVSYNLWENSEHRGYSLHSSNPNNHQGRKPSECEEGFFEDVYTFYSPSDEKPDGW